MVLWLSRREALGPSSGGHDRRQVSAGPVGVPGEKQRVQPLGPDRVLVKRVQPDDRAVVQEIRRGKPMGRLQEIAGRRLVPGTQRVGIPMIKKKKNHFRRFPSW